MKKLAIFLAITLMLSGCGKERAPTGEPAQSSVSPQTAETPIVSLPDGIEETEITFGIEGWELPGTFTRPKGKDKCPVVILVHGSGPNDRDETIGPNKPFRDIAWGLAAQGIASLRYDKRTFVHGKKMGNDSNLTVNEETVQDALEAEKYISSKSDFITEGVYILGHSLGGYLIPRIAQKSNAAGYIILAGPVTPLHELMVEQVRYISELDGSISAQEERNIKAMEIIRDNIQGLDENSKMAPFQLFNAPAAYWLDLKDYRPATLAKEIQSPLLIVQGERDYQVTMREFDLWKEALEGRDNVTFKSYPGLNHIFVYGTEKSSPEDYNQPGNTDNQLIKDIADWIMQNSKSK